MGHAYHPQCGCAACGDVELAEEARDEAIESDTEERIVKAMRDPEAIRDCLLDTDDEGKQSILNLCEQFFADVEAAEGPRESDYINAAAVRLWRELRGYVHAGLHDNAKDDATAAYDRAARNAA